jgi:hypothetical protein
VSSVLILRLRLYPGHKRLHLCRDDSNIYILLSHSSLLLRDLICVRTTWTQGYSMLSPIQRLKHLAVRQGLACQPLANRHVTHQKIRGFNAIYIYSPIWAIYQSSKAKALLIQQARSSFGLPCHAICHFPTLPSIIKSQYDRLLSTTKFGTYERTPGPQNIKPSESKSGLMPRDIIHRSKKCSQAKTYILPHPFPNPSVPMLKPIKRVANHE